MSLSSSRLSVFLPEHNVYIYIYSLPVNIMVFEPTQVQGLFFDIYVTIID